MYSSPAKMNTLLKFTLSIANPRIIKHTSGNLTSRGYSAFRRSTSDTITSSNGLSRDFILVNVCKSSPKVNTQCRYIHPIVLVVGKQVAKFGAMVTGRAFRKYWQSLPDAKRKYFTAIMVKNSQMIALVVFGIGSTFAVYYSAHLESTPITKRRRFIAFTPEQFDQLSEFQFETEMDEHEGKMYPISHPYVVRVQRVATRLLNANKDIREIYEKNWSVTVIQSPMQNAYVLPSGQIFVFSGMLGLCENDDQLGCVLGHEMAHAILGHGAEQLSHSHLIDSVMIIFLAAIWAMLPSDLVSAITHWFFNRGIELLLTLPYSRKLETEADVIGLQISSKACFDVRESSAFWAKMSLYETMKGEEGTPEFLSTHPAHETRTQALDDIMKDALVLRVDAQCPPLPPKDPRLSVDLLRHQVHSAKKFREMMAQQPHVVLIRPE